MVHRLTRPRGGEDLHRLVEHQAAQPVIALLAGPGEIAAIAVAAEAYPEGKAAAAEPVERDGLPDKLGGPAAGNGRDHGMTMGPMRRRSVAAATAASVIHGSAT